MVEAELYLIAATAPVRRCRRRALEEYSSVRKATRRLAYLWPPAGRPSPAQPSHFLLSSGDLFSLPMIFFCFVLIFFPLGLWRPRTAVGALASVYTRDPLDVAVQSSINRAFWLLDWRFSHTHTSLYLPVSLCCLHSIRRGPKQLILDLFTRVRPSPGSALPNN